MTSSTEPLNAPSPIRETDYWIRYAWIWSLVFLASLIVPAVISLLNPDRSGQARALIIGLALLGTIWHWFFVHILLRRIGNPHKNPLIMTAYVVGVFGIWYFLTEIDPIFYIHLSGAYTQIFIFMPPAWAISSSVLVSLLVFSQQIDGDLRRLSLVNSLFWLLITGVGIVFYLWIRGIIIQSENRKELIQKLEATQLELAASERRAGVLSERQRLAQEIHDTLAQGFASIVMHLEAAEQLLRDPDIDNVGESLGTHIDQARETARDSLEQARRLVWELRPQPLEENGLPEALARAGQKWGQQTGVACRVKTTGQVVALHPEVEITLLRATQEALNNVRKHARAAEVNVTLSYFDDLVVLDVQDNGDGFDRRAWASKARDDLGGYGLTAMRERVEKLGGKLLVESAPREGTTLVLEIPVGG